MKIRRLALSLLLPSLFFSSCIKDEPLYSEIDIDGFDLKNPIQIEALPFRDTELNVIVSDTSGTRFKRFAPVLRLSPGATVVPASGDSVDFEDYQARYTVTSEDKKYSREYFVNLVQVVPLKTGLEDWIMSGALWKYPAPADNLWSSANLGIAIATSGRMEEYPTRSTEDSYSGDHAAILETKKGGRYWGQNVPIFSGSLFRGKFDLVYGDFIKSALFGQIHPEYMGRPERFTGYYKYTPGPVFTDEDENIKDIIDECSIYAVLYRIEKGDTKKESYLTAYDILTSDRIAAKAVWQDGSAKENFTRFDVPFTYITEPDYTKYDYRLAVIFASSKEGDFYRGAVGSKLIVDEVEVVCEYH